MREGRKEGGREGETETESETDEFNQVSPACVGVAVLTPTCTWAAIILGEACTSDV